VVPARVCAALRQGQPEHLLSVRPQGARHVFANVCDYGRVLRLRAFKLLSARRSGPNSERKKRAIFRPHTQAHPPHTPHRTRGQTSPHPITPHHSTAQHSTPTRHMARTGEDRVGAGVPQDVAQVVERLGDAPVPLRPGVGHVDLHAPFQPGGDGWQEGSGKGKGLRAGGGRSGEGMGGGDTIGLYLGQNGASGGACARALSYHLIRSLSDRLGGLGARFLVVPDRGGQNTL